MSSLIPAYPRADQPFQTQRTNHFSTNSGNDRKRCQIFLLVTAGWARPPATLPGHHASRRGPAHRPPQRPPSEQATPPTELAYRPPRRPSRGQARARRPTTPTASWSHRIQVRCRQLFNKKQRRTWGNGGGGQQLWPMGLFALLVNFFLPYTDPPYSRPSMICTLARHPQRPCIFSNQIRWLFFKFRCFDLTIDWMFHLRR
jgi:hypothetical protein